MNPQVFVETKKSFQFQQKYARYINHFFISNMASSDANTHPYTMIAIVYFIYNLRRIKCFTISPN